MTFLVINIAYQRSLTPSNITSRFRKKGILPFDENIFSEDDFAPSSVTARPNPGGRKSVNTLSVEAGPSDCLSPRLFGGNPKATAGK